MSGKQIVGAIFLVFFLFIVMGIVGLWLLSFVEIETTYSYERPVGWYAENCVGQSMKTYCK